MFSYDPKSDGKDIKNLMGKLYSGVKFDGSLLKRLEAFNIAWMSKGPEYPEFLGSNLLGVHPIRFSTRDDDALLVDIYNVDPNVVYENIIKLPQIDKSWAVSTNPILQTMAYTMHRFYKDGLLGGRTEHGVRLCYYIMAYKIFGSLLSRYFSFSTSPAIAKATHERLSNRFLIKKLGSWNEFLKYRSGDIMPPDGLHYKDIVNFSTPEAVNAVNDLQGRIRETIKNIYLVMLDVIEESSTLTSTSMTDMNMGEGGKTVDLVNRPDKYIIRLKESIATPASLMDADIIHLIHSMVNSSDEDVMNRALLELSESYDSRKSRVDIMSELMLLSIDYLATKDITGDYKTNLVSTIINLRGYWSSGSVKDHRVKEVKGYVYGLVKSVSGRKTKWYLAANSLAVIVYLFVRAVR